MNLRSILSRVLSFIWNYVIGSIIWIGVMVLFAYLSMGGVSSTDDDPDRCPAGVTRGC